MRPMISRFASDQRGAVLVETLIAVPVMTILAFGIVEFGSLMWQRQQLQVGVRDAARYWSRCSNLAATTGSGSCNITYARNIAFYGDPLAASGTRVERVPGWNDGTTQLIISPLNQIASPTANDIVIVQGRATYQGSPLYSAIFGSATPIGYNFTMRNQGW